MNRYGLIGFPLSHSFSKIFSRINSGRKELLTAYIRISLSGHCRSGKFQLIADNPDLKGLNVTIPYKEKILPFLTVTMIL